MIRDHVDEVKRHVFLLKLISEQYLDSCLSENYEERQRSVSRISVLLRTFLQSLDLSLDDIEREALAIDSAIENLITSDNSRYDCN
jgi:hypothetical protein